jgi:hypothetical protein
VFDPSVTPLTFVNPAYLLAEGEAATSAVFELSEAREGAVSIYADPACTQPALLTAVLSGDTLTVVVTGGGGIPIPEDTPFYAVITEGGKASAPSPFALTRNVQYKFAANITWEDVAEQADRATWSFTPMIDFFNRKWNVDLMVFYYHTSYPVPPKVSWELDDKTLMNGEVNSIAIIDAGYITLSWMKVGAVELLPDSYLTRINFCDIGELTSAGEGVTLSSCTIGKLTITGVHEPVISNCVIGEVIDLRP